MTAEAALEGGPAHRPRALVPTLPRAAWPVLGADLLSAVGSGLTLPFLLIYLHYIRGIGLAVAGLAAATIALASLLGNLLGGALADRVGARGATMVGLAIAAAGTAALVLVREPWHAFLVTGTIGLGTGVLWPSEDALLAGVVAPAQRSSAFAVRLAVMNGGLGLGALLAALIVDVSSPRSFALVYLVDATSFLAVIPLLLLAARPAPRRRDATAADAGASQPARPRAGYRAVLRDRVFVRLWLLTALLIALGYGQYHSGFPAFATGPGGVPAGTLGVIFAANTFTVVGAQLFVLRALTGRRRTTGILAACAGWAVAWTLALVAAQLGGGTTKIALFALAMVAFGVAETCLAPSLTPIVNDLAPSELAGRYNGAATLAWTTGFLAGPAIAGIALGAGLGTALFGGLIAACAIAAAGTLRLTRHLPARVNTVSA